MRANPPELQRGYSQFTPSRTGKRPPATGLVARATDATIAPGTIENLRCSFLDRRYLRCLGRAQVVGPGAHEPAPLLEKIAAPVGCLGFVLDRVRQGHLADLRRGARPLACPIAECGCETIA